MARVTFRLVSVPCAAGGQCWGDLHICLTDWRIPGVIKSITPIGSHVILVPLRSSSNNSPAVRRSWKVDWYPLPLACKLNRDAHFVGALRQHCHAVSRTRKNSSGSRHLYPFLARRLRKARKRRLSSGSGTSTFFYPSDATPHIVLMFMKLGLLND